MTNRKNSFVNTKLFFSWHNYDIGRNDWRHHYQPVLNKPPSQHLTRLLRMMFPTINIKAVNVELTKEDSSAITQKLAPLSRLVTDQDGVVFDVVIRNMKRGWFKGQYCVSVRMRTARRKYYAVASGAYLTKALSKVRDYLRRGISNEYQTENTEFDVIKKYVNEMYYKEIVA